MKKSILVVLSFLIVAASIVEAGAKTTSNSSLASAIKLYKTGNYAQSYNTLNNIVQKDPSNAVAYYYLAMASVQIGKKEEAIENYSKVLELSTNRQLTYYATKGKVCIENPEKCNEPDAAESDLDRFIRTRYGSGFSKEARSDYEKKKIENLMREINRNEEVSPSKFKEYKDFSGEAPTNDEIVQALRTLQAAGLTEFASGNYRSDISLLTGNDNNAQLMQMLTGYGNSNLNPQVLQSLLTNQFTGF